MIEPCFNFSHSIKNCNNQIMNKINNNLSEISAAIILTHYPLDIVLLLGDYVNISELERLQHF